MKCRLLLKYKMRETVVTQVLLFPTKESAREEAQAHMIGQKRIFTDNLTGTLIQKVIERDRVKLTLRSSKKRLASSRL